MNERYAIGLEPRVERKPKPSGDDGSFVNASYPAAISNCGSHPYGAPNYHLEGDVPELCDIENAAMAVHATLAAIVILDQEG